MRQPLLAVEGGAGTEAGATGMVSAASVNVSGGSDSNGESSLSL